MNKMKCQHWSLLAIVGFAAALLCGPSPAWAQLAGTDFTVLGGSAVTCTDSVINGDAGVALVAAFTQTSCTVTGTVHVADAVALAEYNSFLAAYTALATVPACNFTNFVADNTSATLTPGVYCWDAAVTQTGTTWTLDGSCTDTWIFRIGTLGTGALTGTNFTVVNPGCEVCADNNVYWWTAEAATLTTSTFIGSILAGTSITTTGVPMSFDGQALATDAVTLTDTNICGPEPHPAIPFIGRVTGGGQIPVPNSDSTGRASFGFNAKGTATGASGHFNYLNHVTGLHVNGPVDNLVVSVVNFDGSPNTIRFSGTCNDFPGCEFTVDVSDNGEPGTTDEFGIIVTGDETETTSQRIISRGNIQFHPTK